MTQLYTIWATSKIFHTVFLNVRLKVQKENGQLSQTEEQGASFKFWTRNETVMKIRNKIDS